MPLNKTKKETKCDHIKTQDIVWTQHCLQNASQSKLVRPLTATTAAAVEYTFLCGTMFNLHQFRLNTI